MKKRMFQILDEMNLDDVNNNTRLVSISNTLISADKVKQGAQISIGVDEQALFDIMNEKVIPVLMLVDKEEYFKRKSASENDDKPMEQGCRKIEYIKESPLLSERSILENKLFLKQTFTGKKKEIAFLQKVKTMSIEQIKELLIDAESKEQDDVFFQQRLFEANTVLHTKDGRKIGNAIIIGHEGKINLIKTDYGKTCRCTDKEINDLFHIAYSHLSDEELQYMINTLDEHKHYVTQPFEKQVSNNEVVDCDHKKCIISLDGVNYNCADCGHPMEVKQTNC